MNTTLRSVLNIFQRYKLFLIVVAILGLVFLCFLYMEQIPIPFGCPFKTITGIPCPGCGGIRAAHLLLSGDWLQALWTNPLSCLLCVFCAVLPFWSFYDCYKGKQTLKHFLTTNRPRRTLIIISIILLANWIWNIFKGL